jgi:AbrB family looped-hinge helix DNA binding protein
METTKLSSKGQVVLPKPVREALGWVAGDVFTIERERGGVFLRPVRRHRSTRLEDVAGCLPYKGKPKTIAEMEAAIETEVRERHDRGRY